jgi:hypothetical protein
MSVTRTFTVTVSDPGSGNKYFIDGVQQDTINLAESGTYVFNYPSAHPFRFSTTSDGTHNSGSEYTTGVTVNSSTQVTIVVADSAPQLYYYCSIHSGMGGQANTIAPASYGALGWNVNRWGTTDDFVLGWGAQAWNDGEWGELNDVIFTLTGVSSTSSTGSPNILTEINTGWGSDGWGVENWGSSGITVALTGVEATTGIGEDVSWGKQTWGSATTGWGGEYYLNVASVLGLTGLSATSTVGTPTAISDVVLTPTGQSATSTVGSVNIDFSINVALTGLSTTSSPGALAPADVMGLTGLGLTSAVGSIAILQTLLYICNRAFYDFFYRCFNTCRCYGINRSFNNFCNGFFIVNQVMGLTGVSATASVGTIAPLGYERITATQTANYTAVT